LEEEAHHFIPGLFPAQGQYLVHTTTSIQGFPVAKGVKITCWISPLGTFFSFQERIGAGLPLAVPSQLQGELGWGHPEHHPGGVCHCLPAVDCAQGNVRLDRRQLSKKNHEIYYLLFKMICIEVILHCTVVFGHTSHLGFG
jgi:hypothetical protein